MCLRGSVEGSPHLGQGARCVCDCSFLMCDAKGDIMYIRRPFFSLFRFYSVSSTTINLHLITYLDSDTVYHSSALSFPSQPRRHYIFPFLLGCLGECTCSISRGTLNTGLASIPYTLLQCCHLRAAVGNFSSATQIFSSLDPTFQGLRCNQVTQGYLIISTHTIAKTDMLVPTLGCPPAASFTKDS